MKRTPFTQQAFIRTNSLKSLGGFTIIELMIATTVFSVILLLVTTGILQIGKTYYKGLLQSRTQEVARNITDEISRGIQFSGETVQPTTPFAPSPPYSNATPGSRYGFCINGVGYAYIMDRQLAVPPSGPDQRPKTLIAYDETCSSFTVKNVTGVSGRELLGRGMRLTDLNVQDNGDGTYTITVGVASGEFDLLRPNPARNNIRDTCLSGTGSQFCAISKLTTTVQKRVK